MKRDLSPIAITMGDPSGIGPEVVVKATARWASGRPVAVIGSVRVLEEAVRITGVQLRIQTIERLADACDLKGTLNVLETTFLRELPPPGVVHAASGRAAYDAVLEGIRCARSGEASALVTAPINKEAFAAAALPHLGHTEILAEHSGAGEVAMMLANDKLRVVLVTIHCSLREAIEKITREAQMSAVRLAHQGMRALGIARPRIAVAGLNPHASECGLFGDEEARIIAPVIAAARAEGIDASGPWPSDTVFMRARRGSFDVVIAQYHDQGLIPIKYLGMEEGVNITLGLPFIRTSPDHGTAFDIAGRGIADDGSMMTALDYATRLADNRETVVAS